MDKIRTVLVIMLFFGAALAGCTGEEIEKVVEDNTGEDTNNNTNNTADDTNNTADDTNNTTDDTNNAPDGYGTVEYSATTILAMLGVDGSDDAELDFMATADDQEKFGIHMIITAPMDSLGLNDEDGSPTSGGDEDVEITVINMFDNTTKRVASHMVMTMNMGGMSMEIQMKDTQGQHWEDPNVGVINQVMTNMDTYQPEATWLLDNRWSYEEALEEIFPEDEDECNGVGYMMDSMGDLGPHCMCDDGYDWDDGDMMTCVPSGDHDDHGDHHSMTFICGDGSEIPFEYVNDGDSDCEDGADEQQYDVDDNPINWFDCHDGSMILIEEVNDGIEDCSDGEDEANVHNDGMMDIEEPEIGPDMPEPTAEELAAVNWTTSIDETSGMQTFTGIVTMEEAGEWTYELSIMPTVPPVMKSLKMENDTESFDISLMYGDEVVIDLVTEDTSGWDKGASDITLVMGGQMHDITTEDTDGDGIDDTNWEYMSFMYGFWGMYEVYSQQLELHILSPEYDDDGNELEQTVLASFTLQNTPNDGWTQLGNWTDANDNTWDVSFNCNDVYGMLDPEECSLSLSTYGEANESIDPADFDLALYDTWAEDYTGNAMPSFTLGLSLIALLGACLSRRKIE
tara:strand:+ start:130 stop:2004 length:1875 start_codon:yes stop_codon:yes gene_type:complete